MKKQSTNKFSQELKREVSLPKKIGIDILGGLLILASLLFGWLPGVGGIPLFLAGLGLLATNHEWARRLLYALKDRADSIIKSIFRDHPVLVFTYDVVAIGLLVTAGIVLGTSDGNIVRGFAISAGFLGIGLLLGNKNRIKHLNDFVRKLARK